MLLKSKAEIVACAFHCAGGVESSDIVYQRFGIVHVVENDGLRRASRGYDSNVSEAVLHLPEGLAVKREESNDSCHELVAKLFDACGGNLNAYDAAYRTEAFSCRLLAELDDVVIEVVANTLCLLASSDFLALGNSPPCKDKQEDKGCKYAQDYAGRNGSTQGLGEGGCKGRKSAQERCADALNHKGQNERNDEEEGVIGRETALALSASVSGESGCSGAIGDCGGGFLRSVFLFGFGRLGGGRFLVYFLVVILFLHSINLLGFTVTQQLLP